MNFVDDIRRETIDADYERVIADFLAEFGNEGLTVYNYGRRRPPVSDLDLLVLTDADMSPRGFRDLRRRLDGFRLIEPARRYLLEDGARLCPRDLFEHARALYPQMLPSSFQVLRGAPISVETGAVGLAASQVVLVDTILMRLNDLAYIRQGASVSVRELLKTLQKISSIVQFHIADVVALRQRSYDDTDLRRAHETMTDQIASLRHRAVQAPVNAAFLSSLEECVRQATRLLVMSLVVYCSDFLRSVLTPTMEHDNPASAYDPEKVPEFALRHVAAYAQVGVGPQHLRQRLAQAGSRKPFEITNVEYRRVLTDQMRMAQAFDDRFRRYRVAAFPLAIAGVWHQWEPPTKLEALRRRVGSVREWVGSAGRRSEGP